MQQKHKPLKSLSIFFPFFNDEGTVEQAVDNAYLIGKSLTNNLEVIALHGGESKDNTFDEILRMKRKYSNLKMINRDGNRDGYAVIKHGLKQATKDWVFYTDGDLQYDLRDLVILV